jgi:thiosulfate/3-mercaptopyruvate sulfurtransferase
MRAGVLTTMAVLGAVCSGAQPSGARGYLVSAGELASQLKDPALVILHVGEEKSAFTEGHIPGARFVPYRLIVADDADDLGAEVPAAARLKEIVEGLGVSDSSRVIVYGPPVLSSRLFYTLDVASHPRVAMLDGGLRAWQADGRPLAKGDEAPPPRGSFTPRMDPQRIVTAEWIRKQRNAIALVDVRPDPEFTGSDGGMGGAHVPGHIEGARQLPWTALVGADGRFLPMDQLRAKLAAAGASPGRPVVPYCMVGMRASVVYFVARHLGLDARLYDGSIVDWGRRGLPTKTGQ